MALTTIIGLILAFGFIIWSISTQGGLPLVIVFVDPGSIILVIGCSLSALIINYTFKEIIDAFRSIKYCFRPKPTPPDKVIGLLVNMAIKARKEGFLALRDEATKSNLPILNLGVRLIADGTDPEITRDILETASGTEENQLATNERIWRDLAIYGPMFGMLGTLMGLVLMLRNLSDPSTIGPAMALALITTFYGVIVAGVICLPVAGKIHIYNERTTLLRTLLIEGLISIQGGDNSHIVEEKLKAYIAKG